MKRDAMCLTTPAASRPSTASGRWTALRTNSPPPSTSESSARRWSARSWSSRQAGATSTIRRRAACSSRWRLVHSRAVSSARWSGGRPCGPGGVELVPDSPRSPPRDDHPLTRHRPRLPRPAASNRCGGPGADRDPRLTGDLEVLARRDHQRPRRAPAAEMSPSPRAPRVARRRRSRGRGSPARRRRGADRRRVLADPAGEHERVEAAERRRHRGDPGAQTVEVDVEGEPGRRPSPRSARASDDPHVGGAGQADEARLVLERVGQLRSRQSPCSSSQSTSPGSTLPDRVAITRPSSGVKPIVVSTDRPPRIAHSDAPAPRWQLTIRSPPPRSARAARPPGGRPRRGRARGSRTGAGPSAPARRRAARRSPRPAGRVAWKAVSKQATAGTSGQRRRHRVERGERLRLVERAPGRPARAAPTRRSTSIRTASGEALAAVDDPVADDVGIGRTRRRAPHAAPAGSTAAAERELARRERPVVAVEQRQLEAARPGVDHQHAHARALPAAAGVSAGTPGQVQSRTSGGSSPSSRV